MNNNFLPVSILVAGVLIAGTLLYTSGQKNDGQVNIEAARKGAIEEAFGNNNSPAAENMRPISNSDHVRGERNASVSLVEYSDLECPFCARIHPTLIRAVEEFDGKINWVYRHFPLTSIHPEATGAAIASECVARLAGNDAFWRFTDGVFENQARMGNALYAELAEREGVAEADFGPCLDDKEIQNKVQDDADNAVASGGGGTPYVIVVNKKDERFPFSGALPYEQIKSIIEQALN